MTPLTFPGDVPAFYRDTAAEHPGATLIALGPLTNLAQAVEQYPDEMRCFGQIIISRNFFAYLYPGL
jgi:inosine-uridine nucleoside N-ribohydrolase